MLGVTLNESEIIDKALKGDYDSNKIIVVINLLIKYYFKQGVEDKLILSEKILDFLKANYKNYKRAKWETTINKKVSRYLNLIKRKKIEVEITDIKSIGITKDELGKIKELNDIKLEKIAFVMLIYAKISNIMINKEDGWINISYSMICKEARIYLNSIEKLKLFNKLYEKEYIEQRKKNDKTNIKVNYINNNSDIEIVIEDFNNVIDYYILWGNKDMIRCINCGKPTKKKNNKTIYCTKCAKEIKKEKTRNIARESMKKLREKQNVKKIEKPLLSQ